MDKSSELFIRSILPESVSNESKWKKFEDQLVSFFSFCYPGARRLNEEERRLIEFHAALVAFAANSRLMKNKLNTKQLKMSLKALVSAHKNLMKICSDGWLDNFEDKILYDRLFAPVKTAADKIGNAEQFARSLLANQVKGGRPRNVNLDILIACLANMFIYELNRRFKENPQGTIPWIKPLNKNYDASLKTTRQIDHLVITLVSNFLEAGTRFQGVSGVTIQESFKRDKGRKIDGHFAWEVLKKIRFK